MKLSYGVLAATLASALFAQTKPVAKLEFEVASIRPAAPIAGQPQVNVGVKVDGQQVTITQFSLKDIILAAYDLKNYQVIGPDFIGTDRYDVAAKLPEGTKQSDVPAMLRSLLEDRFKMVYHRDSKEFPVYALTAAKTGAKLTKAEGDAPPPRGSDTPVAVQASGGQRGVNVNYGNGSYFSFGDNKLEIKKLDMPRFCEILARFMDRPVIDMTELQGAYDLTLEMTPEDYTAMLIRSAVAAGVVLPPQALRALEFSSGDSLTSALQAKGLKLESRKSPLPVMVIDKMEKTPSAN